MGVAKTGRLGNDLNMLYESAAGSGTGNAHVYTACEYDLDSGNMIFLYGSLLKQLGLTFPERSADIRGTIEAWPMAGSYRKNALEQFDKMLDPETEEQSYSFVMHIGSELDAGWLNLSAFVCRREGGADTLHILITGANREGRNMLDLLERSRYDTLTGVLNRAAIIDETDRLASDRGIHAFVMVDLDGFKAVNDSLGHVTGDRLLSDVADTLKRTAPPKAEVGRIGGDEFFICIPDAGDREKLTAGLGLMLEAVRRDYGNGLLVTASFGIAMSPKDGKLFEELYTKADIAMYTAKRRTGDCCVYYDESLQWIGYRLQPDVESVAEHSGKTDRSALTLVCDAESGSILQVPNEIGDRLKITSGKPVWQMLRDTDQCTGASANRIVRIWQGLGNAASASTEILLRADDDTRKWYRLNMTRVENRVAVTFTDIHSRVLSEVNAAIKNDYEELTGLMTRKAFCKAVNSVLKRNRESTEREAFVVGYFDIVRFKVINDMFGSEKGDQLLKAVGDAVRTELGSVGFGCREGADRFYLMMQMSTYDAGKTMLGIFNLAASYDLPFEIRLSGGLCAAENDMLSAEDLAERAILAQSTVKHDLSKPVAVYDDSMRDTLLTEHEIISSLPMAMERKQLRVAYQPQYNHKTGQMVGAEALARWEHPRFGAIAPNTFIPIIEKNGLITRLDLYVFETVCAFLHRCIEDGHKTVPISVNVARYDIFMTDFAARLNEIRSRYDVPARLLRVEITESAVVGSAQHINRVIDQLHGYGFLVEMDDFGSGYSSLNVLGRVRFDLLKLDMRFITGQEPDRSSIVLSSVIRMAKWLGLPVIAEGVEQPGQAEYLRSIGCEIVQGFLYSEAITEERFIELVACTQTAEKRLNEYRHITNAERLMDPASLENLIFNEYVGAAAVFCRKCDSGRVELLRVNRRYLEELRMNMSEQDILRMDAMSVFDDENRELYIKTMRLAEETDEEHECVTMRHLRSACCGEEQIWLRSRIRMLWKAEDEVVFFAGVRNITDEKMREAAMSDNEKRFKMASEQVNIYYWEYDIATKEMRPCFRCMRDLGLPAVVRNYPEPLIESGLIQPEDADTYREWIRKLGEGIGTLEGRMCLTDEHIPFMFRYTTEYDAAGNPVKAYGSATLIR